MEQNKMSEVSKKVKTDGNVLWFAMLAMGLLFFVLQIVIWTEGGPIPDFQKYLITEILLLTGGYFRYLSVTLIVGGPGRKKNITAALLYLPLDRREIFGSHVRSIVYQQLFWFALIAIGYLLRRRSLQWLDILWLPAMILNALLITWLREGKLLVRGSGDRA